LGIIFQANTASKAQYAIAAWGGFLAANLAYNAENGCLILTNKPMWCLQ
jgi:hypothetical protein